MSDEIDKIDGDLTLIVQNPDDSESENSGVLNGIYLGVGVSLLMIIVGAILGYQLRMKEQRNRAPVTGATGSGGMPGPPADFVPPGGHPFPPMPVNNPQSNYYGQAQPTVAVAQDPVYSNDMENGRSPSPTNS